MKGLSTALDFILLCGILSREFREKTYKVVLYTPFYGEICPFQGRQSGLWDGEKIKKNQKSFIFFRVWVVALGFPMIFQFLGLNSKT